MIAALVLVLASVRLEPDPRAAQIGEPVTFSLTVEHPAGARVTLPEAWPLLDGSWVLLETGLVLRSPTTTRASWRVISLEPGERTLPSIDVGIDGETVVAEASALSVGSELGQGEDEPRPLRGFLPPPASTSARAVIPWIIAFVIALAAVAFWRWRVHARRKLFVAPPPTPLEELATLRSRARSEPASARAITYGAVQLLRRAVDDYVRETRSASPDDEWLRRVEPDERVPLGVRSAAARIVRDAEQVKYAQAMPTPFALEEMLASTESALAALKDAPPLARPVEVAA